MLVTLEELKEYLRIDTNDENVLLQTLLETATKLCTDIARKESTEAYEDLGSEAKTAVFYAAAYLYEHREEANHRELVLTLRALLSNVREDGF